MLDFKECGPSKQFIKQIDRLFDIQNSCSPYSRCYKSLIRLSNLAFIEEMLKGTAQYVLAFKVRISSWSIAEEKPLPLVL